MHALRIRLEQTEAISAEEKQTDCDTFEGPLRSTPSKRVIESLEKLGFVLLTAAILFPVPQHQNKIILTEHGIAPVLMLTSTPDRRITCSSYGLWELLGPSDLQGRQGLTLFVFRIEIAQQQDYPPFRRPCLVFSL